MDPDTTLNRNSQADLSAADQFEAGQLVAGKYEVISLLGRGGMGTVYRVRHILLNIEMALKTLDTKHLEDANASRRFQTEAKAAFSLQHPNLVKVHDFGVLEDGRPFLVMDFVGGKTLQGLIKERGRLQIEEVGAIFAQLCFGLAHAHERQIVHRDIKPANIMIVDDTNIKREGNVKILDFGIAKIVNSDRNEMQALTQTGEIFGSPYYMSPEQCSGESIDQRCDIYSLGCVLFESLTGTPPLVSSNALRTMMLHVNEAPPTLKEAALGEEFPEELEKMVAKMLAKHAGDRYADIGAVAQELFRICSSIPPAQDEPAAEAKSGGKDSIRKDRAGIVTLTHPQFVGVILATMAVSILATLFVDRGFGFGAPKEEPKVQIKEAINAFHDELFSAGTEEHVRAKKAFEKFGEIKAIPINATEIEVNFPEYAIGKVEYLKKSGYKVAQVAKGKVILPRHGVKRLAIDADQDTYALTNASIYKKIHPDLFNAISFSGPNTDALYAGYSPKDKKLVDDGFDQFFATALTWTNIKAVLIDKFHITPSIAKSLSLLRPKSLELYKAEAPPGAWRNSGIFQDVTSVLVAGIPVTEILEQLTHSSQLKTLVVECRMNANDVHIISKYNRLDTLAIIKGGLPDSVAQAVSKLTNVNDLRVRNTTFDFQHVMKYFFDWEPTHPVGADRDMICWRRKRR